MKEMVYQPDRTIEILDSGEIDGYGYYILSLGTHPTAYINLPEGHPAIKAVDDYDSVDIDCHGGLTYGEKFLMLPDGKIKGRFIGWDYAHSGDYSGMDRESYRGWLGMFGTWKRWTTEEILEEVKDVIRQLKRLRKMNREILFRGKRVDNGEWVYGYYANCRKSYGKSNYTYHFIIEYPGSLKDYHEVYTTTIGQYTGLKDKNGVKIFEGDVVRYGDTIHKVVFESRCGTAYFGLVYGPDETLPFGHYQDLRQIEVIGNVWDSQKLLEQEE